MTKDKLVLEQVHEHENSCAEILANDMNICDIFKVDCLLDKLPPSCSNYVSTMKHKEKTLNFKK